MARLRELALRQRIPIVWLLDSAGARIQSTSGSTFAGAGALFREQVAMSGVVPMVAAMLGHCAAGTAYIPALADFVPDGEGHVVDGARRPPPREGGGGRGRLRGGDGRLGGPHQGVGRRRPRGRRRRGVPRDGAAVPLLLPCAQRRAAAAPRVHRSGRPPRRGALRHRADRAPAGVRHAQGRAGGRRRRRRAVDEAGLGEERRDRPRPRRRSTRRHRRQPADGARRRARRERRRQGGALRVAVRRVRHPARVPARRARVHRRLGRREAGDHPPRRQDAVRGVGGDGAEDQRRACARATAPATS